MTARRFELHRTGNTLYRDGEASCVAEGVLWSDGTVSVRGPGQPPAVVDWGDLTAASHVRWGGEPYRIGGPYARTAGWCSRSNGFGRRRAPRSAVTSRAPVQSTNDNR